MEFFLLLGPLSVKRDVDGEDVFVVLVVVIVGCGEAGAAQEGGVVVVGGTLICCDESVGEGVCQGLSECEKGWEEDGGGGEHGGRVNPRLNSGMRVLCGKQGAERQV